VPNFAPWAWHVASSKLARCAVVQPVIRKHASKSATLMRRLLSGWRDRAIIRWVRRLFRYDRPDEEAGRWKHFG